MTIEAIKSLMKSGDVAGAEAAAQELLTAEPDNVQAMMLYGTCRQLQGDEATFRDTYKVVKEHLDDKPDALDAETKAAWQRFGELYAKLDQPELRRRGSAPSKSAMLEYAIVAALIVAAIVTGIWLYGGTIMSQVEVASSAVRGPSASTDVCCAAVRPDEEHSINVKNCCVAVRYDNDEQKWNVVE